jgi:cysteinyl-tRNA synthetase
MAKLFIYNTLSRQKEAFKPLFGDTVSMYYCGPTVYWTQHVGNLRGAFCADIVVRSLAYLGYQIKWVRNYTDVGHLTSDEDSGRDKMEKAAEREGLAALAIAQKYISAYEQDTAALNLSEPDFKPRATEYIAEMIEMVETLLDKGYAYATPLAVYFDVSKSRDYTRLSGQKLEENQAGAGAGEVSDPEKRHQADFALWFFRAGVHAKASQYWPSPFVSSLVEKGYGFPGWHIECSAMSKKCLGPTIDLHMGGIEHVSVHHTNEIAQSEAANGVKFVNYWLHNEHLLFDSGKMSKSQGTSFSLSEVAARGFKPLALRYLYLGAHYRSKQNFTWDSMRAAQSGLDNLYRQLAKLGSVGGSINQSYKESFADVLADDFNTPKALAVLQEVLKSSLPDSEKLATVLDFDRVLGLNLAEAVFPVELPSEIMKLKEAREKARQGKDWLESDRLRQEIEAAGYAVEDGRDGMKIIKK